MEGTYRTTQRYLRVSPTKLRQVAALVRGKPLEEALALLRYVPKKAGRMMEGALRSVQGNAKDRSQGNVEGLVVSEVRVDEGPQQRDAKRWTPKAMGRVGRLRRRTSHLQVVVARRSGAGGETKQQEKPAAAAKAKREAKKALAKRRGAPGTRKRGKRGGKEKGKN